MLLWKREDIDNEPESESTFRQNTQYEHKGGCGKRVIGSCGSRY